MCRVMNVAKSLSAVIALTVCLGTAAAPAATQAECEAKLDECAKYCDSKDPSGRPLCIQVCNDRYNKCFADSTDGKGSLSVKPNGSGIKPKVPGIIVTPNAPIERQ